jgi:methylthioribose-1-phosphate isomerase
MKGVCEANKERGVEDIKRLLVGEALTILKEDIEANKKIGEHGKDLIRDGNTILTHCNAGALATGGYGTALGVIRSAWEGKKKIRVIATETRPLMQGARLTAWELFREGIPVTLITDNMAGSLMQGGEVDLVIVGADRIARNGDVANKIGTYTLAILAKEHEVPFYVAAPLSTFDRNIQTGREIPIEERAKEEVTAPWGRRLAPEGIEVRNPAFDVTPHRYVSAIVTERGIIRPPFAEGMQQIRGGG